MARLLTGCDSRPWLNGSANPLPPLPPLPSSFGNESLNPRGRVIVWLGRRHRYSNVAGYQYRYRLVVIYALAKHNKGLSLQPNEHIDHIDGNKTNDQLHNLRVLAAEYHGQLHAALFEIAGFRSTTGQFVCWPENPLDVPERQLLARRFGPIISARDIGNDDE